MRVRAFAVRLPSGERYWTVLDDELGLVAEADSFLRQIRFGRDGSELTTRSYAGSIALFLRWCRLTGGTGQVLAGPGARPARGARRVNAVLTAVRGFVVHAAVSGQAPAHLVPVLYEVADDRDLP